MKSNMGDIRLGRKNVLTVVKKVDFGYYLDGGVVDGEVLLPNGTRHWVEAGTHQVG